MAERLLNCAINARWGDLFYVTIDGGHSCEGEQMFSVRSLTAEVYRKEGNFSFALENGVTGRAMDVFEISAFEQRVAALRKAGGFKTIYVPRAYSADEGDIPRILMGFKVDGRGSDAIMNRFLEMIEHLGFQCLELQWPRPKFVKVYEPHIGRIPLGNYLARKYYPGHVR